MTAGIGGSDEGSSGALDTGDFFLLQLRGLFGLGDIVDARAAAAVGCIFQLDELEPGHGLEDLARLTRDSLTVAQMTGLVVGDFLSGSVSGRLAEVDRDEPLGDVTDLAIPFDRLLAVVGIVLEEVGEMFQMRSATGRVRDDRVERIDLKLINETPCLHRRLLEVAVVGVQRTAATLLARGDHFAAVGKKHLDSVAVHFGKDEILDTAGEHPDTMSRVGGFLHFGDELGGKVTTHDRRGRL